MSGPADRAHETFGATSSPSGRRFYRDEEGVSMVTFALMITVILGFSALATDVGTAYWQRRMVQNAVDGASLAGASQLASNLAMGVATPATSTSQSYAMMNGLATPEITTNQVITIFNPNDAVEVDANRLDNYGMRYIVGAGDTHIGTGAQAIVEAMMPNDLWPFGVTAGSDCSTYPGCIMKKGSGNSTDGNFGLVCFQGNNCGTQDYVNPEITSGYNGPVPSPTPGSGGNPPTWNWQIQTEPGNKVTSAVSASQTLMTWDANWECDGGNNCANLYQPVTEDMSWSIQNTAQATLNGQKYVCIQSVACPRVGVVPLIQQAWTSLNGNTPITVVGFACFYMTRIDQGGGNGQTDVYGVFLNYCTVNTSGSRGLPGAPLGSTGVIGTFIWR
jgi:Flp pilus assembly protein TadG